MKYKILISSINGPLGYELVKFLKRNFYIIGCDQQPWGLANIICDEFYISPKGNSKQYLKFLDSISSKVDQIFLFSDEEILNVSRNRKKLKKIYPKILISDNKTIELCNNKPKLKAYLKNYLTFPLDKSQKLIIKPKIGRGSKYQIVIDKIKDFKIKKEIERSKEYFVEEFIEGKEYTIDCVYDFDNKLLFALPRERIIKSNLSIVGKIIKNHKIINYIKKLSKYLKFVGNVNIQIIINKKNQIFLTDINPRVSGSIIFSIKSGFNPFEFSRKVLKQQNIYEPKNIKYDKIYYRYWKTF